MKSGVQKHKWKKTSSSGIILIIINFTTKYGNGNGVCYFYVKI